jgi:hypothetical protein
VGQILKERELEFKERKKRSLGALMSGSTHVALAVWYKHLAGIRVLSDCLPYVCNGLGAFHQFPRGETLLNKTERERESQPESSTTVTFSGHSSGKQTPLECQMLMVTFLGSLSQFGTTYTNLT